MIEKFEFYDGKYKIERDSETYRVKCYRYDERWEVAEDQFVGNRLLHAMLDRIRKYEQVN